MSSQQNTNLTDPTTATSLSFVPYSQDAQEEVTSWGVLSQLKSSSSWKEDAMSQSPRPVGYPFTVRDMSSQERKLLTELSEIVEDPVSSAKLLKKSIVQMLNLLLSIMEDEES